MTALEFGLELNKIGMLLDDENYKKIKPSLDRIEEGLVEIFEGKNRDAE